MCGQLPNAITLEESVGSVRGLAHPGCMAQVPLHVHRRPRELVFAERATGWLQLVSTDPSPELRLAIRGHKLEGCVVCGVSILPHLCRCRACLRMYLALLAQPQGNVFPAPFAAVSPLPEGNFPLVFLSNVPGALLACHRSWLSLARILACQNFSGAKEEISSSVGGILQG